jgi:hypothetical protein
VGTLQATNRLAVDCCYRVRGARRLADAPYDDASLPPLQLRAVDSTASAHQPDEAVELAQSRSLGARGSLRVDSKSGVRGHHRRSAFVHGVDDLGVIDAAQVDRGHAEIRALDLIAFE